MDTMDIAALSTISAQTGLSQAVAISVMTMAKDQAVQQGQDFIRMLERSVQPHLGSAVDIRV